MFIYNLNERVENSKCSASDRIKFRHRSAEQCSFEWRKTYSSLIISSAKEGSRHTPVQTDEETEKHNFWYLDTQRDATPYQKHQAPFIMDGGPLITPISDH